MHISLGVWIRRTYAALLLIALFSVCAVATPAPDINLQPPVYPFTLVVYGDIRFTNTGDTKHSNPQVREALVRKIAEARPAFVALTGDIVLEGAHTADWSGFDRETKIWRDQGLTVLPTLGNHDVRGGEAKALASYFQRFPAIGQRRWYSARDGNVLLFAFDSTSDDAPGSPQWRWLEEGLAAVPGDVDFIFITLHHPPYTKSSEHMLGGGHDARQPERELARMLEQRQAAMRARIIVVAGHVHNYERYEHGGVTYIVSGGGGATPYLIRRGPNDFYNEPGPTYHFCLFTVDHGMLQGKMVKYMGPGQWAIKDQFDLKIK